MKTVTFKKNRVYCINRREFSVYRQRFAIFGVDLKSLESGTIQRVFENQEMIGALYPDKLARDIDFFAGKGNCLSLIFDDEILLIRLKGHRPYALFKVKLSVGLLNGVFCGSYNGDMLFCSKMDQTIKIVEPRQVRFVVFEEVAKKVNKMEKLESEVEQSGEQDQSSQMDFEEAQELVVLEKTSRERALSLRALGLKGEENGWIIVQDLDLFKE